MFAYIFNCPKLCKIVIEKQNKTKRWKNTFALGIVIVGCAFSFLKL